VLHDSFRPDSDIDVLVEFEQGHTPGFAFIRMQDELSALLAGRKVDMVTAKFLNRRMREKIQAEAVTRYVQG
jgi:predicted nucleotidyltransferase